MNHRDWSSRHDRIRRSAVLGDTEELNRIVTAIVEGEMGGSTGEAVDVGDSDRVGVVTERDGDGG
jgi:hypothetical protein